MNTMTQTQVSTQNDNQAHDIIESQNMRLENPSGHACRSMNQTLGLKLRSVAVGLIALMGMWIAPPTATSQSLEQNCYTFETLTVGDRYVIGDSISTQHATINIRTFFNDGVAVSPDPAVQRVEVKSSTIAGSDAPELYTYLANVQVVPDTPLASVSMRFGRSGGADPLGNLWINGELGELDGLVTDFDNMILGDPELGRVLVRVYLDEPHPRVLSTHLKGRIELIALTGQIHRFTFGMLAGSFDDVCLVHE